MFIKHKKSHFISMLIAMLLVFSTVVTASATTLNVTRVKQAKTKWCWAATSQMIGNYMNSSSNRSQWDVVAYVKDSSYPNVGGTTGDIRQGIRYASGSTVTYTSGSICSWLSHTSNINSGNPIGVWMNWDSGGAHALVCAGTKTTSGSNYLYIIDPWEDNTSEWYNYNSLKNGTKIQSGTGSYDTSFWKS